MSSTGPVRKLTKPQAIAYLAAVFAVLDRRGDLRRSKIRQALSALNAGTGALGDLAPFLDEKDLLGFALAGLKQAPPACKGVVLGDVLSTDWGTRSARIQRDARDALLPGLSDPNLAALVAHLRPPEGGVPIAPVLPTIVGVPLPAFVPWSAVFTWRRRLWGTQATVNVRSSKSLVDIGQFVDPQRWDDNSFAITKAFGITQKTAGERRHPEGEHYQWPETGYASGFVHEEASLGFKSACDLNCAFTRHETSICAEFNLHTHHQNELVKNEGYMEVQAVSTIAEGAHRLVTADKTVEWKPKPKNFGQAVFAKVILKAWLQAELVGAFS